MQIHKNLFKPGSPAEVRLGKRERERLDFCLNLCTEVATSLPGTCWETASDVLSELTQLLDKQNAPVVDDPESDEEPAAEAVVVTAVDEGSPEGSQSVAVQVDDAQAVEGDEYLDEILGGDDFGGSEVVDNSDDVSADDDSEVECDDDGEVIESGDE